MTERRTGRAAARLAVAIGALVAVTLGTGGVAAASIPNDSVTSAKIVNNTIRGEDVKNGAITPLDVSSALRPRWATVQDDGATTSLLAGRGVEEVGHPVEGTYLVRFTGLQAAECGFTATLMERPSSVVDDMVIYVSPEPFLGDDAILVRTSVDGSPTNVTFGFTVQALC